MHIIQSCTIKTTEQIHDVVKCYGSVECTRLRLLITLSLNHIPRMCLTVVCKDIIESLLFDINPSKNYHFVFY